MSRACVFKPSNDSPFVNKIFTPNTPTLCSKPTWFHHPGRRRHRLRKPFTASEHGYPTDYIRRHVARLRTPGQHHARCHRSKYARTCQGATAAFYEPSRTVDMATKLWGIHIAPLTTTYRGGQQSVACQHKLIT